MLKLLKNMRRKEALMALICLVFVVGQIYFDLRLPDYMTRADRASSRPPAADGGHSDTSV